MREYEPTADDLAKAAVEAVRAIEVADTEYADLMIHDLLRAAWPSLRAQNQ